MIHMVKDIPVSYEVMGAGTPILMLHGWSPDHRLMEGCMEPVLRDSARPWQRIYLDLPGMGRTPGKPWLTGSDRMLEVLTSFIDGVMPDRHFLVAGESYGGYLARGLVAKMGARIDGMLLICPLAEPDTRLEHAPAPQVLERDAAFLAGLPEADRQSFTSVNVIQTERVWWRFKEEVQAGLDAADQEFLQKYLGQKVSFSFTIDSREIPYPRPVLLLMGRQDHMVGYRDQWQFIEAYPRAAFAILDKAGHNLQIEQAGLFEALVREWLERVAAESGV